MKDDDARSDSFYSNVDSVQVWFRLVDLNGRDINGRSDAIPLEISQNDRIAHFQRKLLNDPFCKKTLTKVDFTRISIYQDQWAFKKRAQPGALLQYGRRIVINGVQELGSGEDHPLLVMLPCLANYLSLDQTPIPELISPPSVPAPPGRLPVDSRLKPNQISFPCNEKNPPPFIAPDGWTSNIVQTIMERMSQTDGAGHVPPMALMRCSRGGKTRALKEVGMALRKKLPEVSVIYISFSNDSPLNTNVETDLLAALLRRIAFAASSNPDKQFNEFKDYIFSEEDFKEWLGDVPGVLLVDELNILTSSANPLAQFVKEYFLDKHDRYFVFTSQIAAFPWELVDLMDCFSNCSLLAPELPVVTSLNAVKKEFRWSDLSLGQIFNYGCIPSLLWVAFYGGLLNNRRKEAIQTCLEQNLLDDNTMKTFLWTFLNGNYSFVPYPLLALMDSYCDGHHVKVRWIPFHMAEVLQEFYRKSSCSDELKRIMKTIVSLFDRIKSLGRESGDARVACFVLSLLIRCVSGDFDSELFPHRLARDYIITFNEPFAASTMSFNALRQVTDLLQRIPPALPPGTNQIAIYYPFNSRFKVYDVIMAIYRDGCRTLVGYQLREGKGISSTPTADFIHGVAIRADAPLRESQIVNDWHIASETEIDKFFGLSGQQWTPKSWKRIVAEADNFGQSGLQNMYLKRKRLVRIVENFEETAFDKTKDVLVLFYAPWCNHSKVCNDR